MGVGTGGGGCGHLRNSNKVSSCPAGRRSSRVRSLPDKEDLELPAPGTGAEGAKACKIPWPDGDILGGRRKRSRRRSRRRKRSRRRWWLKRRWWRCLNMFMWR